MNDFGQISGEEEDKLSIGFQTFHESDSKPFETRDLKSFKMPEGIIIKK